MSEERTQTTEDAGREAGRLGASDRFGGLRMTRQRREVHRVLMEQRDHPTAHEVFVRARETLPHLSLATVYSCLEALVAHGVVRQVNFDREPSRFCPNLEEHGHFHDRRSGSIHDITFKQGVDLADLLNLPPGAVVTDVEITLRGELPAADRTNHETKTRSDHATTH